MKLYKSILSLALAGCLAAGMSSCRDDFSEININPADLTSATPTQLLCTAEMIFQPYGYGVWFFNAKGFFGNNQMSVPSGSVSADALKTGTDRQGIMCVNMLRYLHELEYELSSMDEATAASYQAYVEAIRVLAIYSAILDADTCGDIPYTEAAMAKFGGTLTPAYDTVESLYGIWDKELASAASVLANPPSPAASVQPNQDVIYACDWSKWAKLANSLRVKLATRLIHRDLAKAKSIVAEAVASPAGLILNPEDDFLYFRADAALDKNLGDVDRGDIAYGTTNTSIAYNGICAAKNVVDFMVENGDPRVRFLFTKNSWNSKIVDYYLRNGFIGSIPPVVLEKVDYEPEGDNYKFVAWKGKGEPWVRFIGLPDDMEAGHSKDPEFQQYFNYNGQKADGGNQIEAEGTVWSYRPYSAYNEEYVNNRYDFTVPRAPGDDVIRDNDDNPRYDMYFSSAEMNFYLAEFATYGGVAGLGNAATYFENGVRASVAVWDKLAALNKIPYYGTTYGYDDNEKPIDLVAGEIDALLQQPAYQLTADKDANLEKIFLNMLFHFAYSPVDQFVTGRRSGIPKFDSDLFPRTKYDDAPVTLLPRRTALGNISPADLMGPILEETYKRQGFSTAKDATDGYLNTQRVWQDVGAPQYGEGPNVK